MIGLRYNKMKGNKMNTNELLKKAGIEFATNCSRCDEELDNNTSLDDIVLCYDCAMDKAGY
jgi:predicted house-cleaning NTP pyrophosphatase (Maf/HAM1 superfamily)